MADNSTNFEKMSFLEMLEQHPIEIPMIQRDYAQGRESQKKLFQNFLKALKIAVCESPIELDFVYGDIKDNKFHPLDGQQRLTTLFLLHWYAAACSKSPKDNARILCRFTYCTRISSRSFCEQILKNIDEYKPSKLTPAKWIEDQSWFRAAWKKDPTVSGMISALNSIQEQFGDINDELWGKLNKHTEPAISFHKTTLDSIGLSDDLYIKMNARGKALSSFENMKAQVDRKIEKEQWENGVPHALKFNHLIDTEWTNLIWKSFGKEKFDQSFIRFFANIAVYAIINDTENDYPDCNGTLSIKVSLDSVVDQLIKDSTNLSIEYVARKVYEVLYGSFCGLCLFNEKQLAVDGFNWFEMPAKINGKTISIFKCIGEPKLNPTMQQRLLCFAIYEYAQKNHKNIIEEKYYIWLRFIRNIVQSSNIDNLERFISAARFIHKMAEGCGDIYAFIGQSTYEDRGFASEAVKREKKKAEMISVDRDFMEILHCLEDTQFCYGNLTFPFRYISNTTDVSRQKVRLKHVLSTINTYFSEGISDLHRRALLTVGDGSYYKYWGSWLYAADGNKHRLLMNIGDLRDNISHDELSNSLSAYFDLLNTQTPDQLITAFDHSDKEHWRYKLIKDPSLLQKSTYKYFTFSSDGKCYLIPRSKVENSNEGKRRLIEVGIHAG